MVHYISIGVLIVSVLRNLVMNTKRYIKMFTVSKNDKYATGKRS